MTPTSRFPALAAICMFSLAATLAFAQAPLDTSALPRPGGVKQLYASPNVTTFVSSLSVAQTADATQKALAALGWQRYEPPFTGKSNDPNMSQMTFKKGAQALGVFISVAPAQNNATSVQYGIHPLATDLPFPADAQAIEFSPDRPYLKCTSAQSLEATLAFFSRELGAQGWSPWSPEEAAKIPPGQTISKIASNQTTRSAYAYFVREGKKPVRLTIVQKNGERTMAEIAPASAAEMDLPRTRAAERAKREEQEKRQAEAREKAQADFTKRQTQFDAMTADILKQALQSPMTPSPARPPAPVAIAAGKPLQALAKTKAPVALPDTAEGIDFKSEAGRLEYTSASSVADIAAFYRAQMKSQGWSEKRSVINRANMVALNFTRNRNDVSFTIMQMGPRTKVSAHGAGLKLAAAHNADDAPTAGKPAAIQPLEAQDQHGLPVPKEHTSAGTSRTPFRIEANATVSADLPSVLAFYRSELARKNWKEDSIGAKIGRERAVIAFTSPDGPALLTIERKTRATNIVLALRKESAARKSGLLPKKGQVKLLFGNILDAASKVTINRKTIDVAAGVGAKGPDGPTMELPPGKYTVTVKTPGKPVRNERIEIGANSIWGVMIGPGGVLPLQMY